MLWIYSFLFVLLLRLNYSFPLSSLNIFDPESDNNSRTAYRLRNEAETGRAVILFCRNRCLKLRSQISKLVRNHNEKSVNSSDDRLYYQFFAYKKAIGLLEVDEVMKKKQIGTFYLVGGKAFLYDGDYTEEDSVSKWISFFESPTIHRPEDHVELESILNEVDKCNEPHKKLVIVIQDEHKCPDVHSLINFARGLKTNPNITVVEVKRPLTTEMEAVLKWRMPYLSDACKMTIYLHSQTYYEADSNVQPSLLHNSVVEWTSNCNQTTENNRIRSKLTEIQLEYLSEERTVQKIQDNQVYVVVGAIGGIAVIALAISIFWGLQSA